VSETQAATGSTWTTGTGVVAAYPLTAMQLGMLVDSNLSDRPWVNVEQIVCHLDDEPIDVAALEAAWAHVQDEHEILRTSFTFDNNNDGDGADEPMQQVHESAPLTITVHDRSHLTDAEREVALHDWLIADRDRGIDVAAAPGMRLTLFVDGPRSGVFVWTVHHALVDGRGFTLALQDAFDAYETLRAGNVPSPRSDRPRFADHVTAALATDAVQAEAYFRDVLSGYDEPVDMAGALGTAGAVRTAGRHREVERWVPAATVARLAARSASSGATLATAVMAAWALLLGRSTYRSDVVFGSTRSGRHTIPGADELVGCLITSIPIRARIGADDTVDNLLAAIRGQQDAVRPHEHASLVDIHRWSDVPRTVPLYTTGVVFERSLVDTALRGRGGLWASRRFVVLEESGLPLFLAAYGDDGAGDDGLLLRLEYDTDRFTDATAALLGDQLAALLGSLADAEPDAPLGSVSMLTPGAAADIVDGLNPPRYERPSETALDTFERVAARAPDSPALSVAGSGATISYGELDRRANQLAHVLRHQHAGPDRIVAICLPRSPEFVIAMFAAMKAGAAYLPIDPTYPAAAVAHMLDDSAPCAVVTTAAVRSRLPGTTAAIVDVDRDRSTVAVQSVDAPDRSGLGHHHPAYVIYTSGSSGRPKGVLISHGALAAFCEATIQRYKIVPDDRILQFASLSFDISIEEILPTLLSGATLLLRTDAMAESIDELLHVAGRDRVTVLNLPTAFWHDLVDHLDSEHLDTETRDALPSSVRLSIVGGEKVNRHAYERWAELVPGVRWMNGYGPTEATVTSTLFDPAEHPSAMTGARSGTEVPIGVPLLNTRLYVLGPDRSLVPRGVAGQLWVGGASVANGYHNRPELTAEKFLADPFDPEHQAARMYSTGDLARWLDTGDVDFLGRIDRQVKVRGFRIEPGEIEANLERQPEIAQAFVAVRDDVTGDMLVAWVTPKPGATVDGDAVRQALRATSPAHMVPSIIVPVGELPRTPGGKVDVGSLPEPPSRSANLAAGSLDEPADDTERGLCETFARVLRLDQVGVDESFFELGGHSLLAVRLLGRLRRDVGHHISLSTLYSAPTPRELASRIRTGRTEGYSYLIPIKPTGSRTPIFGVHVLGTNACYYRPLAARLDAEQPLYGLSFSELDENTPTDIATIAATYAAELERFRPSGPIVITAVSLGGYVAFELAQQLVAKGRQVAVLAIFDGAGPGGRPQASRAHRLRIHLALLRLGKVTYLRKKVTGVAERFALAAGVMRARVRVATGRPLPDALRLHSFVQANVGAADSYAATPYPGRITVFRAQGEVFDAPEVATTGLGWSVVAAGGLDVIDVPGDHMSIFEDPFVATLADELDAVVRAACEEPSR